MMRRLINSGEMDDFLCTYIYIHILHGSASSLLILDKYHYHLFSPLSPILVYPTSTAYDHS